jgi:uncharacterized protein (TIRG00374 family)
LLANLASIAFKSVVWRGALRAASGVPRARYRDVVPALFIGFLLNTILLARVGEVARIGVLRRRLRRQGEPAPVPLIAASVVAEQLVLGIALVALLLGMTVVLPVPEWAERLVVALVVALALLGLALAALELLARSRRQRAGALRGRPAHTWWGSAVATVEPFLQGFSSGQQLFARPGRALVAVLAGVASWAAQIVGIYWTLDAFGIHHGLGAAGLVFFTSTLVQIFPVLPGNIGVFQAAVALPLQVSYGIDTTRAVQFSIGMQLVEALLGVGLGFVFLAREGLTLADARRLSVSDDAESS